jgi:hypothetical protein
MRTRSAVNGNFVSTNRHSGLNYTAYANIKIRYFVEGCPSEPRAETSLSSLTDPSFPPLHINAVKYERRCFEQN